MLKKKRAAATVQVVFIDKDELKLFPFGARLPRKLKTQVLFESMILTCAEMAGEQNLRKGT
jgi:hypothetical protein